MILFILKISESEQFDDAQLKGKTAGHSKEEGSDMTKTYRYYLERILR
jgi:hypothetical protein